MTGQFYIDASAKNQLDRPITPIGEGIDLTLYMPTDIINPTFKIKDFPNNANYLYVPSLDRYYFIRSVTLDKQCSYISCTCDVLKTYASAIKNLECYISRNEYKYNMQIPDSLYTLESRKYIHGINFGNNIFEHNTGRNYILTIK